jgi:hypothetical protein
MDRRLVLTSLAATAVSPAFAQTSGVARSDAQMSLAEFLADIFLDLIPTKLRSRPSAHSAFLCRFSAKLRICSRNALSLPARSRRFLADALPRALPGDSFFIPSC